MRIWKGSERLNKAFNIDCMEYMKTLPDKFYFEDPYGININNNMGRRKGDKASDYKKGGMTNHRLQNTSKSFFEKNQIVWGEITLLCRQNAYLEKTD